MDSYSLADIKAVTEGNDCGMGFGGGSWVVWILLFALLGGNGFGWGGNRGNVATTEDLASGFNFNALQGKTNDILAAVNGVNQNLGNAICSSTYELGGKIDACCCTTQNLIGQVRYDMAVQNGDIKALIHSEAEATRNMMRDNENANLRQQLNFAQMQGLMCGIPRISPYGYGVYAYPSCQTGCGCNGAF